MLTFSFVCVAVISVVQTMPMSGDSDVSCGDELKGLLDDQISEVPECLVEIGGNQKLTEAFEKPIYMAFFANPDMFDLVGQALMNDVINMTKKNADFKLAVLDLCKVITIPLECVLDKAKEKDLSCDFKLMDVVSEPNDKETWTLIATMHSEIEAAGLESCAKLSAILKDN